MSTNSWHKLCTLITTKYNCLSVLTCIFHRFPFYILHYVAKIAFLAIIKHLQNLAQYVVWKI